MFWGGIIFNRRTQLIHIPGTTTGAYYLQNIINAIVQLLRNEIGDQFIFMDDNARPHRTRAVQQALEKGNIARLKWPAMSPDINPITEITLQEAHATAYCCGSRGMGKYSTGSD
nr:unnamed protein product [Callosobruchus chinensis]